MRKIITAFAICFMATMLISTVTVSSAMAQPHSRNTKLMHQIVQSQIVCAAHWTEAAPMQGGWIFASLVRDNGYTDKAWLYVSGFHPAGVAGPNNATFSAVKQVELNVVDEKLVVAANMKFNVTSGDGTTTTAIHAVNVNWSIPQGFERPRGSWPTGSDMTQQELYRLWLKGVWMPASADISIDTADSASHADLGASDWATIGILSPQHALTIGHWVTNSPVPGGWVFAAAGKNEINGKAWLMVAGFHPTGALGINMPTTFQGVNSDVCMRVKPNCMLVPTATINFTVYSFEQGPITYYETHNVSLDSDKLCSRLCSDWNFAHADIAIDTGGGNQHSAFSCSSFAIVDIHPPHK